MPTIRLAFLTLPVACPLLSSSVYLFQTHSPRGRLLLDFFASLHSFSLFPLSVISEHHSSRLILPWSHSFSRFVIHSFAHNSAHLQSQHSSCYYCLIIFPRLSFHSFSFSHIYDVSHLLIFYLNFRVGYYVHYRFPLFIFFSQLFTCSSFIPTIDLVILSPLSPWYHSYRSCLQPARFLYQLSGWWLFLFQFYRATGSKVGCTP